MARYYSIAVTGGNTYTSYVNGQNDPGALNVEMDVYLQGADAVTGMSAVKIWGVPLSDISQAKDLYGKTVTVMAGMKPGLPLANTQPPSGLLFQGLITKPFGNWQGTDMTLELNGLVPAAPSQTTPGNFTFDWKKGTPMSTAIAAALKAALPSYKQTIDISPKLIFTEDMPGYYQTTTQFAQFVKAQSAAILGGSYAGVSMLFNNNTVTVYDGTVAAKTVALQFTDLVGQATWIGPQEISIKTVMRADISCGDSITLPPGQVATTAQSLAQFRQGSVFQGTFLVSTIRHVGNFRAVDGNSWCTIFTAVGPNSTGASSPGSVQPQQQGGGLGG